MREPELIDSVRRFFGSKARLTRTQAARLIEEHGANACLMAVPEMLDRNFEWDPEVFGSVCYEVAKDQRQRKDELERGAWRRHVAAVEAERADPASRARVDQIRAIHADFRAQRIDNREMLRRVAAVVGRRPRDEERDAQVADLLATADELDGAMYGGLAAAAEGRGGQEEVPF